MASCVAALTAPARPLASCFVYFVYALSTPTYIKAKQMNLTCHILSSLIDKARTRRIKTSFLLYFNYHSFGPPTPLSHKTAI